MAGVRLLSLQKGKARAEIAELAGEMSVVDLGDDFDTTGGAFMDTAALMRHVDLVIAVDTSVVHLAGGLGVPVWVPLALSPDWRWTLAGNSTAWYPAMRLFRQRAPNQWASVFAEMAAALALIAGRAG